MPPSPPCLHPSLRVFDGNFMSPQDDHSRIAADGSARGVIVFIGAVGAKVQSESRGAADFNNPSESNGKNRR